MAPAHMGHGSSVTTRVTPSNRHPPSRRAARRSTSISACAVASPLRSMRLDAAASTVPSRIASAPTGTSPRAPAARASCSAARIRRSSSTVWKPSGAGDSEGELNLEVGPLRDTHRVVDEPHALERDAVDRAVVFADAAVRAAVVVDVDLAFDAAALGITHRGLADQVLSARRALAVLTEHHHVDRLLRTHVVAGAAEDADRLVVVVHRIAL